MVWTWTYIHIVSCMFSFVETIIVKGTEKFQHLLSLKTTLSLISYSPSWISWLNYFYHCSFLHKRQGQRQQTVLFSLLCINNCRIRICLNYNSVFIRKNIKIYMAQTLKIVYQTIIEQWKKFYLFIVTFTWGTTRICITSWTIHVHAINIIV